VKVEKEGLAEAMEGEEEVMVVEVAAAIVVEEAAVVMVEAKVVAIVEGGEAAEDMEEEEVMEETDHPNAIAALLQLKKVKRSRLQLTLSEDEGMGSPVSTTL
jgi:hypothetical protein